MEIAALSEPVAVSWHAVRIGMENLHQPLACCRIVVLGGGAIGLAAAIVARHFGGRDIRIGETNPLRHGPFKRAKVFDVYAPARRMNRARTLIDLVIDAVGASATRAAASAMVRPGGVIVHAGLLPGLDGLDIRKITLQEVTFSGTYCYTPVDFIETVRALQAGSLGGLRWFEERPLSEGARASPISMPARRLQRRSCSAHNGETFPAAIDLAGILISYIRVEWRRPSTALPIPSGTDQEQRRIAILAIAGSRDERHGRPWWWWRV